MSKATKLEASRSLIKDAFSLYTPIVNDIYVESVKGSRCLVSPFAFEHKRVVQFVNSHKSSRWLLFCYTQTKQPDLFKFLALHVWQLVKPKLAKNSNKKMQVVGLLIIPALIDCQHICLTGKPKFTAKTICDFVGIDEKNNHWYRDYKESWAIIVSEIMSLDSSALHDLDKFFVDQKKNNH